MDRTVGLPAVSGNLVPQNNHSNDQPTNFSEYCDKVFVSSNEGGQLCGPGNIDDPVNPDVAFSLCAEHMVSSSGHTVPSAATKKAIPARTDFLPNTFSSLVSDASDNFLQLLDLCVCV